MNRQSKVTIIIPIYNVETVVSRCLSSTFNQTYNNIEYILIDDCGDDNSMSVVNQIISDYHQKDVKIIRHTHNRGLSAARNTGIENATGDYIFFVDSDDEISVDCIERHLLLAQKYDVDFTDANVNIIGGRNVFTQYKDLHVVDKDTILLSFFNNYIHVSAWNKLYKRSFILQNNLRFVEGLIYEDTIWCIETSQLANRIATMTEYTYNYYINNNTITTTCNKCKIIKQYDSRKIIFDYVANLISHYNTDRELLVCIYKWIGIVRFKVLAKLVCTGLDLQIKKKIYYDLKQNPPIKGFISFPDVMCRLPYVIFAFFFSLPYKLYMRIKTVL